MFTLEKRMEKRVNQAFARFWEARPSWWVDGLVRMTLGRRTPRMSEPEQQAQELLARHLVRDHVRRVWEARRTARRLHGARWAAALAGETLDQPPGEVQALALAVQAGRLAEVRARVRESTFWPEGPSGPATAAYYRAGTLLAAAGEFREAIAAFDRSRVEWYERRNGGFPLLRPLVPRSGAWRFGVPSLPQPGPRYPYLQRMEELSTGGWPPGYFSASLHGYHWVIADTGASDRRILRHLGVPRSRQILLASGGLPPGPLRGRVALVTDVDDGKWACLAAQAFDADVIDIGSYLDDEESWERPIFCVGGVRLALNR